MQALPHMWRMSVEEQRRAQDLLQQAIALDPEYAHAHALLGWTYVSMFNLDARMPIGEFTDKALDAGERAVALDEQDHWGHLVLGLGHARRRRPEPAVMHLSQICRTQSEFCARPCRARLCLCMRRAARARAAIAGAGATAEPARSVSRNLCAGRAIHGAVCARAVRGDDSDMPVAHGAASQPCRCLAVDDCVVGIARENGRGEGGARAHARPPA